MPMTWDATNSMQMLLLLIAEADVKPSTAIWTRVASKLGDITPSAASQKFYKLKKECEQLQASDRTAGPSTPKAKVNAAAKTPATGRGRKRNDATDEDRGSAVKRRKKAADVTKEEPEEDDAQGDVKAEEEASVDYVAD